MTDEDIKALEGILNLAKELKVKIEQIKGEHSLWTASWLLVDPNGNVRMAERYRSEIGACDGGFRVASRGVYQEHGQRLRTLIMEELADELTEAKQQFESMKAKLP